MTDIGGIKPPLKEPETLDDVIELGKPLRTALTEILRREHENRSLPDDVKRKAEITEEIRKLAAHKARIVSAIPTEEPADAETVETDPRPAESAGAAFDQQKFRDAGEAFKLVASGLHFFVERNLGMPGVPVDESLASALANPRGEILAKMNALGLGKSESKQDMDTVGFAAVAFGQALAIFGGDDAHISAEQMKSLELMKLPERLQRLASAMGVILNKYPPVETPAPQRPEAVPPVAAPNIQDTAAAEALEALKAGLGPAASAADTPSKNGDAAGGGRGRRKRRGKGGNAPPVGPEARPPTDAPERIVEPAPAAKPRKAERKDGIVDVGLKRAGAAIAGGYRGVQSWRETRRQENEDKLLQSDVDANTRAKFNELQNLTDKHGKLTWSEAEMRNLMLAVAKMGELKPEDWWKYRPSLSGDEARALRRAQLHFRRIDVKAARKLRSEADTKRRAAEAAESKRLEDIAAQKRNVDRMNRRAEKGKGKLSPEEVVALGQAWKSRKKLADGSTFTETDALKYMALFGGLLGKAADTIILTAEKQKIIDRAAEVLFPLWEKERIERRDKRRAAVADVARRSMAATRSGLRGAVTGANTRVRERWTKRQERQRAEAAKKTAPAVETPLAVSPETGKADLTPVERNVLEGLVIGGNVKRADADVFLAVWGRPGNKGAPQSDVERAAFDTVNKALEPHRRYVQSTLTA
ncbi:MAG: hypothetical protein G01um10148_1055 [Parcubacteria group bacterium Gr01-1014_8]|nr:MAG: hypothetical protein G01um10148_1055 [Parcubacteria group bacterium Gr01-1014_8]